MERIDPSELIEISKIHSKKAKRDIAYNLARKLVEDAWREQ